LIKNTKLHITKHLFFTVNLTILNIFVNFTDMGNMTELTVLEIAEKTGLHFETVKARIRALGIEPARKVGKTNIYDPKTVDLIKEANPVGRPKKAEPETPKPKKGK